MPLLLRVDSLEWGLSLFWSWQSLQSWLELSRTSSVPSPVPAARTVTVTGAETIETPVPFRAHALSVYVPAASPLTTFEYMAAAGLE